MPRRNHISRDSGRSKKKHQRGVRDYDQFKMEQDYAMERLWRELSEPSSNNSQKVGAGSRHKTYTANSDRQTSQFQPQSTSQPAPARGLSEAFEGILKQAETAGLKVERQSNGATIRYPDPHQAGAMIDKFYEDNTAGIHDAKWVASHYFQLYENLPKRRQEVLDLIPKANLFGVTVSESYQTEFWVACSFCDEKGTPDTRCFWLSKSGMESFRYFLNRLDRKRFREIEEIGTNADPKSDKCEPL